MAPRSVYRQPLILMAVSIAIAIVAAVLGSWFVVAFMVLNVAFQTTNLVIIRRRMARHN